MAHQGLLMLRCLLGRQTRSLGGLQPCQRRSALQKPGPWAFWPEAGLLAHAARVLFRASSVNDAMATNETTAGDLFAFHACRSDESTWCGQLAATSAAASSAACWQLPHSSASTAAPGSATWHVVKSAVCLLPISCASARHLDGRPGNR